MVSDLIVGVVVNVLGHVGVEDLKSSGVEWIPASAWDFVGIWDTPEFSEVRECLESLGAMLAKADALPGSRVTLAQVLEARRRAAIVRTE